ncbi:MAG: hypothetical protein AAFU53_11995 [Cyanobacteria bacterium J06632_3]
MPWLKLTEKSLYLMEGGEYLKKVDLRDYNGEQALDIPFDWFRDRSRNLPMVVAISQNTTDVEPKPKAIVIPPVSPAPSAKPVSKPPSTGKDLASRILAYIASKGYTIFEGMREYNIVYVEGMDPSGRLNRDVDNVFNDIRLVIEVIDGKPRIVGGPWLATTEPGRHYVKNPMNAKGAARIQFNQYRAWQVGSHNGNHEALIQTGGTVTVHRDFDRNGLRTGDRLDTGYFGINQHNGYDNPVNHVGKASAGCLVGRSRAEHKQFMRLIKQDWRYQQDKQFIFTSTIIAGDDFVKHFPA